MSRLTTICVALGMILFAGCAKDPSSDDPGMHAGGPPPLRSTDQLRPAPAPIKAETAPTGTAPTETAAAIAPAPAEPVSPQPVQPKPTHRMYTVQKGDVGGFWSIARKLNGGEKQTPATTARIVAEIAALNPQVDPKNLRLGQQIKVPVR